MRFNQYKSSGMQNLDGMPQFIGPSTLPGVLPSAQQITAETQEIQHISVVMGKIKQADALQFLQFCIIGTLNALIDFGVLNMLLWLYPTTNTWKTLGYNSLAVLLASTNSFFWNKYWTFRQRHPATTREVFRFVVLTGSTVLMNDLLMGQLSSFFPGLMNSTFIGANVLKLGAIVGTMSISFFGMRLWVFLRRERTGATSATKHILTTSLVTAAIDISDVPTVKIKAQHAVTAAIDISDVPTVKIKAQPVMKKDRISTRSKLLFFSFLVLALFALACWMRWYTLDVPFDRDGYDEGVYWQSLRSLAQGYPLYGQIFYSQPPAFLLSIFPLYLIFGQSILAARTGIVLLSLCGLLGALFVGKVLRGNGGALLALLLLVANPLYLWESQTLQADGPSTALMLLALGLAYLWWARPTGLAGYGLAILTTIVLVLSILSKLFGLADLVPIGLLVLAHLWRIWQQPSRKRFAYSGSLLAGACALVLICVLFTLPFSGSFSPLWDQIIAFHTAAKAHSTLTTSKNLQTLWLALATPLGGFALYGTLVSLVRRDWRVLPLIAWFLAIVYLLWQQLPLLPHHLVTLAPPLVLLAMMSLVQYPQTNQRNGEKPQQPSASPGVSSANKMRPGISDIFGLGNIIAIITLCMMIAYFQPIIIMSTYQSTLQRANGMDTQMSLRVAQDVDSVTRPDQLVITDAQFLVAEADRNTPPQLVDTSFVRIQSGYLSNAQLIQLAMLPSVHTVLFYTGRLRHMREFHLWVGQHFQKVQNYGQERELWTKKRA